MKEWLVEKWVRDPDLEDVLNRHHIEYDVVAMFRNAGKTGETTTVVFRLAEGCCEKDNNWVPSLNPWMNLRSSSDNT